MKLIFQTVRRNLCVWTVFISGGQMQSRYNLIGPLFFITVVFMFIISFLIPVLSGQGTIVQIVIMVVAGVVLAGIHSAIVMSTLKKKNMDAGMATDIRPKEIKTEVLPARVCDEKAVQILAILQRKGRLIDFLQENISAYEDSQIGAAVRNIHKECREAIAEHLQLEPVMKETEGANVTVNEGFDPSAIRLTGNVVGSPPFRGVLRHSGWKAAKVDLPVLPKNIDSSIIEPAEIELP